MVKPERRTPIDIAVSVGIVVLLAVAAIVVWQTSSVRHAHLAQHSTAPFIDPPMAFPTGFARAWTATTASTEPVTNNAVVVTTDRDTVYARHPLTGDVAWSYQRDDERLCGVASEWGFIVAAFTDSRGCGDVTELSSKTGQRQATRSSDADKQVRLSTGSSYVLSQGKTRLELWRSDLVRTVEYGRVSAPVNPRTQPRSGCTLLDAQASSQRIAVLEQCPHDAGVRLTMLNTSQPDSNDPKQVFSSVMPNLGSGDQARLVGVNGSDVAVYQPPSPDHTPAIVRYGSSGQLLQTVTVRIPANGVVPASPPVESGNVISWWTGAATLVLNADTLHVNYQIPDAVGPGTMYGNRFVVAGRTAVGSYDPTTGRPLGSVPLPVESGPTNQPVYLSAAGPMLIMQRGPSVTALRPVD